MASVRKRSWTTGSGEKKTAWRVDYFDASGQRGQRQFATKREAVEFRIETEGKVRAGSFRPDATKVAVREVCEAYLEYAQGRMERGERFSRHHFKIVSGHIRNHILHPEHGIGGLKLAQLTVRGVGDLRDNLRNNGVSVVTTRKVISTLHSVLEYAMSFDLVGINAARGVRVIGRRDEGAKKIVPPTKEDLRRLIDGADPDFRVQLIFASATGLRAGELHALRWQHVDFEAGEITVETRVDAYGDEDVTKTAAGMRVVPLSQAVIALLKEWRLRSEFSRLGDLVFPNRRGNYQNHDNMAKRYFKPLFEKAGVLPFTWHGLRHFAISTWIEAGLSPKTIQTFAGHSSLQVTMDRYGHLFKSDDHRRAMDQIGDEIFRTSNPI